MNIVEWFYVVMCVGIAWIVLTTPYLVEKLVPNNWEKIKAFARAIEKAHGIGGGE